MSATNNDGNSETKKPDRASERKRAWRIRKKPESERSVEDVEWLESYVLSARKSGRPAASATPEEPETTEPEEESELEDELPAAPPPPPPPRIDMAQPREREESGKGNTHWRKKYEQGGKDAGRERTVTYIASQWKTLLVFACEQIKMSGGTPMVDVEMLYPHLVITVDDALPERITLKSSHIAAVGTTVILGQRIARHKKIGEAYAEAAKNPAPDASSPSTFTDLPKSTGPQPATVDKAHQASPGSEASEVAKEENSLPVTDDVVSAPPIPLITLAPDLGTGPNLGDVY